MTLARLQLHSFLFCSCFDLAGTDTNVTFQVLLQSDWISLMFSPHWLKPLGCHGVDSKSLCLHSIGYLYNFCPWKSAWKSPTYDEQCERDTGVFRDFQWVPVGSGPNCRGLYNCGGVGKETFGCVVAVQVHCTKLCYCVYSFKKVWLILSKSVECHALVSDCCVGPWWLVGVGRSWAGISFTNVKCPFFLSWMGDLVVGKWC